MLVYFDGSHTRGCSKTKLDYCIYSWGIIGLQEDDHTEISGFKKINMKPSERRQVSGCHEIIAFVEACLYASAHSTPEETTFYTDDEMCVYANYALNSEHYSKSFLNAFDEHLNKIKFLYNQEVFEKVQKFIRHSRFVKVKGHSTTIYNLRVDYLAKCQRDVCLGEENKHTSFEEWLKIGFTKYNSFSKASIWFPAFC